MTTEEIVKKLEALKKRISWLEWAVGPMGQLHWDVAVNYDLHRDQLEAAKAERAQLQNMLASQN